MNQFEILHINLVTKFEKDQLEEVTYLNLESDHHHHHHRILVEIRDRGKKVFNCHSIRT